MSTTKSKRPDMRDYFRAEIDREVNGMMSRATLRKPAGVVSVAGKVTDRTITVTMRDGSTFTWSGGEYSSRKVNLCYAPLMPKPVTA